MNIEQKQNKIIRPTSIYTMSAEEQNQITSELQNLIAEGGLTPSENDITQVKTAVKNIADQSAAAIGARTVTELGTITQTTALDTNTNYTATLTGSATFTLPTPSDTSIENTINLLLTVSATTTVDWGVNANSVLTSFSAGKYELRLRYNNSTSNWIGEVLKAEATPNHTKCFISFNDTYADQTNNITLTPASTITYTDGVFTGYKTCGVARSDSFTISGNTSAWNFGTGAFTVSCWYKDNNNYGGIIARNSDNSTYFGTNGAFKASGTNLNSTTVSQASGWVFYEWTRDNDGVFRFFINGVQKFQNSVPSVNVDLSSLSLLSGMPLASATTYLNDVVITDQAGHTANYDVPDAPYVLADNSLADLHDKSLAAKIADLEAEINNLKGAIMKRMDFANAVALTMNSGTYTMPSDGYLQLNYNTSTAASYSFKLNSKDVYVSNVSLMPVSKDDILGLNSTPFNGFFIPEKTN